VTDLILALAAMRSRSPRSGRRGRALVGPSRSGMAAVARRRRGAAFGAVAHRARLAPETPRAPLAAALSCSSASRVALRRWVRSRAGGAAPRRGRLLLADRGTGGPLLSGQPGSTGGDFLGLRPLQAGTLLIRAGRYLRLGAQGVRGAGLVARRAWPSRPAAGAVQAIDDLAGHGWSGRFDHNGIYHLVPARRPGTCWTWGPHAGRFRERRDLMCHRVSDPLLLVSRSAYARAPYRDTRAALHPVWRPCPSDAKTGLGCAHWSGQAALGLRGSFRGRSLATDASAAQVQGGRLASARVLCRRHRRRRRPSARASST
jgi:hypothetical protein